jgi:hypothetical protein
MKVRSQTRLVRRGAVYYFRVRTPADLKLHFGGKRGIMESLRTSDKKEAEQLVRAKSVELDHRFGDLRGRVSIAPKTRISDEDIARIVAKATATRMKADEEIRMAGLSDWDWATKQHWLEELEAMGRPALARGQVAEGLHERTEDWLRGDGYKLARDSEDYRRFAYAFSKALVRGNRQVRARDRGEPVETPPMPLEAPP